MGKTKVERECETLVVDRLAEPHMYKVILLNDDVTTMDFVVELLEIVFDKSHEDATKIMLEVHNSGKGVCGIYPLEIAELKQMQVHQRAKKAGYPLKCTLERI